MTELLVKAIKRAEEKNTYHVWKRNDVWGKYRIKGYERYGYQLYWTPTKTNVEQLIKSAKTIHKLGQIMRE